jgi:maltodextrin utilization protein YvdJ
MPATRVAAYKVLEVKDKVDEIKGTNDWFKNNKVSVILFAVAGVMLILIIVLLLIKPSDEQLEDVVANKTDKKESNKKN